VKAIKIEPAEVVIETATATDTQVYKADVVILAVPPSVWGNITVAPQLINDLRPQMGVAVKHLTALSSRFWVNKSQAPSGSVDKIGMIWEGTDNQSRRDGKEIELTVFAGGDTASKLMGMSDKDREEFYQKTLDDTFSNQFIEHQIHSRFMSWPTEAWTMAGYSFPNVGEVCTKIKLLNEVFDKRMIFAGEHTCLAFVGYMEGALQSGRQAAMKVPGMIKK
jgi:monoamine oxidase